GGFDQPPLAEGMATLAGTGTPGDVDGPRNQALFDNPVNVVVAPDGDVLVADFGNSKIRRVTPDGEVSTISLAPEVGMFVRPFGMVVVGDMLFVQTDGNSLGQQGGAIWRMRLEGGAPELVRDNVGRPRGMALLPDGRIALADYQGHVVRVLSPDSGTLGLLAGTFNSAGFADGSGASAKFNEPYDLVVTPSGDLLVSDLGNHRIRRVTMDGEVTTFAGTGTPGLNDGPIGGAVFNAPQGLAIDGAGNVFVTDTGNFLIREISAEGVVRTVAGDGSPGYRDSENPSEAQVFGLEGIDIDPNGPFLYIADGNRGEDGPYHRVRRCTLD
ncbi:MAG TPA: hypothetical protein VKZ63_21655, partial [Kofleriaceae bacterium]|nr:hypothetical protein [Kofleriaceae bacterium]